MFLGGEGNNIKIDITYAFYGFGALAGMTEGVKKNQSVK